MTVHGETLPTPDIALSEMAAGVQGNELDMENHALSKNATHCSSFDMGNTASKSNSSSLPRFGLSLMLITKHGGGRDKVRPGNAGYQPARAPGTSCVATGVANRSPGSISTLGSQFTYIVSKMGHVSKNILSRLPRMGTADKVGRWGPHFSESRGG